uniref:Uncharacterized protein n=1 Tax=Anopheles melas TaxID=34690 RepID=A0A182TFD8_9DIPT
MAYSKIADTRAEDIDFLQTDSLSQASFLLLLLAGTIIHVARTAQLGAVCIAGVLAATVTRDACRLVPCPAAQVAPAARFTALPLDHRHGFVLFPADPEKQADALPQQPGQRFTVQSPPGLWPQQFQCHCDEKISTAHFRFLRMVQTIDAPRIDGAQVHQIEKYGHRPSARAAHHVMLRAHLLNGASTSFRCCSPSSCSPACSSESKSTNEDISSITSLRLVTYETSVAGSWYAARVLCSGRPLFAISAFGRSGYDLGTSPIAIVRLAYSFSIRSVDVRPAPRMTVFCLPCTGSVSRMATSVVHQQMEAKARPARRRRKYLSKFALTLKLYRLLVEHQETAGAEIFLAIAYNPFFVLCRGRIVEADAPDEKVIPKRGHREVDRFQPGSHFGVEQPLDVLPPIAHRAGNVQHTQQGHNFHLVRWIRIALTAIVGLFGLNLLVGVLGNHSDNVCVEKKRQTFGRAFG